MKYIIHMYILSGVLFSDKILKQFKNRNYTEDFIP